MYSQNFKKVKKKQKRPKTENFNKLNVPNLVGKQNKTQQKQQQQKIFTDSASIFVENQSESLNMNQFRNFRSYIAKYLFLKKFLQDRE